MEKLGAPSRPQIRLRVCKRPGRASALPAELTKGTGGGPDRSLLTLLPGSCPGSQALSCPHISVTYNSQEHGTWKIPRAGAGRPEGPGGGWRGKGSRSTITRGRHPAPCPPSFRFQTSPDPRCPAHAFSKHQSRSDIRANEF